MSYGATAIKCKINMSPFSMLPAATIRAGVVTGPYKGEGLGKRILRAETAALLAVGMGRLHVEMNWDGDGQ